MAGAACQRLRVIGGKVDFLNLRGANLRDVSFVDCVLVEPDLGDAVLHGVTFERCRLVNPQFRAARCTDVDLSQADLHGPLGVGGLKGAILARTQVIEYSDLLAAELGIRIRD